MGKGLIKNGDESCLVLARLLILKCITRRFEEEMHQTKLEVIFLITTKASRLQLLIVFQLYYLKKLNF